MPRTPRIQFAGATYHITARGNRGAAVFGDREDSEKFLSIFEEVCADHKWDAFAWVLMPDRYRLTVRTNEATLASGMKHLNGSYAQWANSRRGVDGHLLEGRYKAIVVDPEAWLPALVRLSALAPVRAGLADRAEKWLWGSYRYLARSTAGPPPVYLADEEILGLIGANTATARSDLAKFVEAGIADPTDVDALEILISHNEVLGSQKFSLQVQGIAGLTRRPSATIPKPVAAYQESYSPPARAMAAAYWIGGYRQKDIANAFGVHISTASRAGARYKDEFIE